MDLRNKLGPYTKGKNADYRVVRSWHVGAAHADEFALGGAENQDEI
jgi:hypothetical protein